MNKYELNSDKFVRSLGAWHPFCYAYVGMYLGSRLLK
jgi:hypothetical protein